MSTGTSPTARALRTLEILRARPGTTSEELAERLGVTDRAARRYVAILREAGVPVESERGPHGGYRLRRGTRLAPVTFTQAEALGLVMAVLDGRPAATDPGDPVGSALDKVVRVLPEEVGRQAAALREHAAAAPDPWAVYADPAVTNTLVEAVAARRRAVITYRSGAGEEWRAEVDPWAVVVRRARWYLLCHSHRSDAVRTYRIDRIGSAEETRRAFRMPDDLDPVAVLEAHLGTGWAFPTHVVFDAPLERVAPWIGAPMGRLEALGDRCVLRGSTRNPAMYAQEWLAAVPFGFRVLGGAELRSAVAAAAARLAAAVADPADGEVSRSARA
ncbi:helix-turn-helix transcriptional regulator [Kitasatospora cheerisanensis]|uniref:ArsR family transcriptional regulator n=1 Tax=Kitasatospora cheerisanensis KCTC 2395 TaxID=1348663 RepID=A0A066YUP2_9ACTN|nr:WYL domain-containing protein [Kitasatospora cheerisanensis]KDN81816.1 ArsR family transcriptional regulator [Kitasatospora cheerisanensis KCTC 2395]